MPVKGCLLLTAFKSNIQEIRGYCRSVLRHFDLAIHSAYYGYGIEEIRFFTYTVNASRQKHGFVFLFIHIYCEKIL